MNASLLFAVAVALPLWMAAARAAPLPSLQIAGPGLERLTGDGKAPVNLTFRRRGLRGPEAVALPAKLSVRGSSSRVRSPKKSYRIHLPAGRPSFTVDGMNVADRRDWVLQGCYFDRSCLRNALAYSLAASMGLRSPRFRFVELTLGKRRAGLYMLVERIAVDMLPNADRSEAGPEGTFIVRREGLGREASKNWTTAQGTVWSYHAPSAGDVSPHQKNLLRREIDALESLSLSEAWSVRRADVIDERSWVDFALLQELSNNPDAYWRSMYMTRVLRKGRGVWAMGPVWDFDLAFGNGDFRGAAATDVWAHRVEDRDMVDDYVPFVWERLWSDDAFVATLRGRWRELRRGPLRTDQVLRLVDTLAVTTRAARLRDEVRWKTFGRKTALVVPGGANLDAEIARTKVWLVARLAWMDAQMEQVPNQPLAARPATRRQ